MIRSLTNALVPGTLAFEILKSHRLRASGREIVNYKYSVNEFLGEKNRFYFFKHRMTILNLF
jgi:hypothetical protein